VGNVLVKSAASTGGIARIGGDGTGDANARYRFAHNTMILNAASPTAIRIQDHVQSLQLSDNVIYRQGGGAFTVVRTAEQVGTASHAGQNNWIASNATGTRPEWTGTVAGTTPGFTNLGSWNLVPLAGSAIHNTGVLPTTGPAAAPFPNPLAAPLFHPPSRTIGLPGSEQARPAGDTIDIGAYERTTVVPSFAIDDVTVTEGDAGTAPASFAVRLSAATTQSVTVAYATASGTAASPADLQAASGTLTLAAGATTGAIVVPVVGDTTVEPDETFTVTLSSPSGATLGDAQATGTISDDDAPPLGGLELGHGTSMTRVLAGGTDSFRIAQASRASYEVTVDAASGDIAPVVLERLAADQVSVLQSGVAVGSGPARTLRWQNVSSAAVTNQPIRVRSTGCTSACGPEDTYRVSARDTTYTIPRFNNTGTQSTVLLVQNTTNRAVAGRAYFWGTNGALLGQSSFTIDPHALLLLPVASVGGTSGQGGSVTVTHDGGYGALAGKAVSLEPAAGYSFDSPMSPRAR
jgi:hypothetical protein